jgi:hypothetical protein
MVVSETHDEKLRLGLTTHHASCPTKQFYIMSDAESTLLSTVNSAARNSVPNCMMKNGVLDRSPTPQGGKRMMRRQAGPQITTKYPALLNSTRGSGQS